MAEPRPPLLAAVNKPAAKAKPDVPRLRKELTDREKRIRAAKEDGSFDEIRSRFNEASMASGTMMDERGNIVPRDSGSPMPKGRGRGGVRRKDESREEFRARMDAGMPRGMGAAGTGVDVLNALKDRNLTPQEAAAKASIIRAEGGQINRDGSRSKRGVRPAPQSSTGRDYDPVAARERMMGDARAAVAAKKEQQAADDFLLRRQEEAARTPGTSRGFANKYGTGQATTLTPEQFAKRKPATVTEGGRNPAPNNKIKDRNMPQRTPITNDLREVINWMNAEQESSIAPAGKYKGKVGMPALDSRRRLQESDARMRAFNNQRKNQVTQMTKAFNQRGMA
jgi:hypothetical protein